MKNQYCKFTKRTIGIGTAVITAALVAGCGGAASDAVTALAVSAGNSPFIGVNMRADCSNGATGQASIGTSALPGVGTIVTNKACVAPFKITAIGAGKMRPIGAPSDGTQDVVYDPAVNIPISNIMATLPAATAFVNANPVTTLVAEQVAPGAVPVWTGVTSGTITAAKGKVEVSLALSPGDADRDYRTATVAAAATRIVDVAALAAGDAASKGMPAAVTVSKPLGQLIAEKIALAAKNGTGSNLNSASLVATAVKTGTTIDVTAYPSVTVGGTIDTDATRVQSLITSGIAFAKSTIVGFIPASLSDMLGLVAADTMPAAVAGRANHNAQVAAAAVRNVSARMVLDVNNAAANTGATLTAAQTARREAALAASAKVIGNTDVQLSFALNAASAALASGTLADTNADLVVLRTAIRDQATRSKAVTVAVNVAIAADATATTPAFATPSAVGVANPVAIALVAKLEDAAKTPGAVVDAAVALKVAYLARSLTAPAAVSPATLASLTELAAFNAAVAAVATRINPAVDPIAFFVTPAGGTAPSTNLQTAVTDLQTQLATLITNKALPPADIATVGAVLAQQSGMAALGAGPFDFATAVTVGTAPAL